MRKLLLVLGILWTLPAGAADAYPVKPVRWLAPVLAGGAGDLIARAIAPRLSEFWGQPVVIDNRPGGGGTLGMGIAARMPGDGYTLVLALPLVRSGRLKVLATTGPARAHVMPDVPTVSESGLKGYEVTTWYGVLLPAGTPAPIVGRIHAGVTRAIRLPELQERFVGEGGTVVASAPDEFRAFISRELVKWARVAKVSGAKVD